MATVACADGCGRQTRRPAWPDGPLCASCARRRIIRRGDCPGCDQTRSLPGIAADGAWVCKSCAGITEDLRCHSCGATDDFRTLRQCRRCALRRRLERVFDDGTGHIDPRLVPFVEALGAMEVPRGGLSWVSAPATTERIRAIATGQVPLTHDGIDQLPESTGREHLRDLLVAHRVLPDRDRTLAAYERWATNRLAAIDEPAERRLIAAYLRWHHQPRLEGHAQRGELTENRYELARSQTNIAVRFLAWLRARGTDLTGCTQADIDAWFANGPSTRTHARSFLNWAMRTRRCPTRQLPLERQGTPRPMPEPDRLALLARLLDDDTIDLAYRVAGCLVLLYALPSSRISRLRLTDLHATGDGLMLQLGDPVPIPPPLDELITELAENRRTTGAGPDTDWLFPSRRAGQAIEGEQLAEALNRLGINRAARTAALNALLADVPAPVLAKTLDRRPWRVALRAQTLGTDWARYAALKARS